ncbi:DNA-directed RNA polymerase subunit alpha [Candidatus Peregrinibacteria bacterium]|nr:DNA-directed RNA polymerase subunit alpha [Candidatus Peregrinibacteria bacterium]
MHLTTEQQAWLDRDVAELNLSGRTLNFVTERLGISKVRDLLMLSPNALHVRNYGDATRKEIYGALASIGFYRTGHEPVNGKGTDTAHSTNKE